MSLATRKQFFAAYLPQRFSLPDSMIYFIAKNPKSSQVYQKLIQTCKYFRHKNPILVFHCLLIDDDGWKTCSNESECETQNLTKPVNINIKSKLWIQNRLQVLSTNQSCASDLIPFIYQCDAYDVQMCDQKIPFQQFLFYFRNVECTLLERVVLNSDVGTEVPLEEIITNLPNLRAIMFEFDPESKNVSSDTVKKLLQIPHFKNLKLFTLRNIFEEFDIEIFFDYYKKMETKFDFYLDYDDNVLSEEYAAKIEEFITYVLDFPDQMHSVIFFPGQDYAKLHALMGLNN